MIDMNNINEFWKTEYQIVSTQFVKLVDLYIKSFVVYLGVMAFALKFALDKNATPELKKALCFLAFLCCMLLFGCILCAEIVWRKLHRKRKVALEKLRHDTESELFVGHWVSVIFFIFNICAILGWLAILFGWLSY